MNKENIIQINRKKEKQTFLKNIVFEILKSANEYSVEQIDEIKRRILYTYFESYLEAGFNAEYFAAKLERILEKVFKFPRGMVKSIVKRNIKKFNK